MTGAFADVFSIVNGPEDGTEFPISRSPFHIGSDPRCLVHVALDESVAPHHAYVTVVEDGYRVRAAEASAALYVDGKRVGGVRSRVVRHGGLIQVGSTLICVECAPDGLASRSRGLVSESDAAYVIRHTLGHGLRAAADLCRRLGWTLIALLRRPLVWTVLAAIVYLASGTVRNWVNYTLRYGLWWLGTLFS